MYCVCVVGGYTHEHVLLSAKPHMWMHKGQKPVFIVGSHLLLCLRQRLFDVFLWAACDRAAHQKASKYSAFVSHFTGEHCTDISVLLRLALYRFWGFELESPLTQQAFDPLCVFQDLKLTFQPFYWRCLIQCDQNLKFYKTMKFYKKHSCNRII